MSSPATGRAPEFTEERRHSGETNVDWVTRMLKGFKRKDQGPTCVLLLGGRTAVSFRLRVAQSHLRDDLSPSWWSHAVIMAPESKEGLPQTPLYEISLEPPGGFGFAAEKNALQKSTLEAYGNIETFPNIALLRVPVAPSTWLAKDTKKGEVSVLERFKRQRAVLDGPALVLEWLGFVWGVGGAGNPLLDGHGIPSAAMIETILSAAGYDVTPGLESGASCPEAIWQAAKWWHKYYTDQGLEPLEGNWHAQHRIADYLPEDSAS